MRQILFAAMIASAVSITLTPMLIRLFTREKLGQEIRSDGPQSHQTKRGTPTMGGSLIIFAVIIPTVLWSDLGNPFVLLATLVTAGFGVIGFLDDFLKIRKKSSGGRSRKKK